MKIIILLLSFVVFDAFADVMEDARKQGLDFGGGYKDSAASTIVAQNKSNVPGYTTDNPEQTKYFNGADTSNDARAKIKTSQEGDLMAKGLPNRPQVQVSLNDSFLNKSTAIEKNPDEVIRMLTGTYGECKPLTYTSTDSEVRTCDEYEDRTGGTCVVGQEVTVDAKHNYQCSKERKFTDKTCDKTLNVICASKGDCTSNPNLIAISGTKFAYNYPYIDVYLTGGGTTCTAYYSYINLNISDLSAVSSFRLQSLQWDDISTVKINGQTVYNYNNNCDWALWFEDYREYSDGIQCETSRTTRDSPNIDLKPYLVQGNNKIETGVGIAGWGFLSARYVLYQNCCNSWQESWGEVCQN